MRAAIIFAFLILFCNISLSQTDSSVTTFKSPILYKIPLYDNKINTNNNTIDSINPGSLKHSKKKKKESLFPLNLGLEVVIPVLKSKDNESVIGGLFYIDLNLWKKIVLMKFEYGGIFGTSGPPLHMFSVGGIYKFVDFNRKHILYGGAGLIIVLGDGFGGGSYYVLTKYLFAIGEDNGITAGVRFLGLGSTQEPFWKNAIVEIGEQILF